MYWVQPSSSSWFSSTWSGKGLTTALFLSGSLLPKAVKRRVHALKRLQVQCANIEAKFYEEVHELERKYAVLYQPLYDKVLEPAYYRACLLYCHRFPPCITPALNMLRCLTHLSLFFQRRDVITGTVEPTDEECEWQSDREEEEDLAVS